MLAKIIFYTLCDVHVYRYTIYYERWKYVKWLKDVKKVQYIVLRAMWDSR